QQSRERQELSPALAIIPLVRRVELHVLFEELPGFRHIGLLSRQRQQRDLALEKSGVARKAPVRLVAPTRRLNAVLQIEQPRKEPPQDGWRLAKIRVRLVSSQGGELALRGLRLTHQEMSQERPGKGSLRV